MKKLIAPTEEFIKEEKTKVATAFTSGSSVQITVDSTEGFAVDDYVAIGHQGNELCELQQVESVDSDTTMTISTIKFAHSVDEPIQKFRYNQRKFYGATSATGTYTELTADGSPKAIQVDDPQGTILEYTDDTYTYFKSTYYNSTEADETDIDDAEAVLGDESLRYTSIYAIRKHSGLAGNIYYSDSRIEIKRKQAESEINSYLSGLYTLPLTEVPALLSYIAELLAAGYIDYEEFGAEGEGVKWLGEARSLLKGLAKGDRILIGADGVEITRNTKTDRLDGYPDSSTDTNAPQKFTINEKF